MGAHAENFYGLLLLNDLVDQAVLGIDPPGVQAGESAHQIFISGSDIGFRVFTIPR